MRITSGEVDGVAVWFRRRQHRRGHTQIKLILGREQAGRNYWTADRIAWRLVYEAAGKLNCRIRDLSVVKSAGFRAFRPHTREFKR